ncbi:hypothetical protein FQN57_004654 [Myotisia sp. PD_48]|nr:hypothetical protein FQN57_004654 [Myotisia sp. PD_48]
MFAERIRSSNGFTKLVVCLAVFTDVFLYGLIVPVLPFALRERLGIPDDDIQKWNSILLGTYGAAILVGSLVFGWLGDRTRSRQTPFVLGLIVLGGATLLFALGSSITVLMIARVLQGASTAIVFTVGFALLFDKVGKHQIGDAMGWTSMSLSTGLFLGPVMGGVLYERLGYLMVFVPAIAAIGVEIVLRSLVIEEDRYSKSSPLLEDSVTTSYGTAVYGSDRVDGRLSAEALLPPPSPESPPTHSVNLIAARSPILKLLSSPRLLVAMLGLFTLNSFTTAFEGVLPVYVHELFGVKSTKASLIFMTMTIPMLLSPVIGKLVDRVGAKWPATIGFAIAVPALILQRLVIHDELADRIILIALLSIFGCGVAMAMPPMMTEVTFAVEEIEEKNPGIFGPYGAYSQAYGLTNAAFAGGALTGPLYAGFLRKAFGWPIMALFMGCLSALVMVLVMLISGGPLTYRRKPQKYQIVGEN